jgi:hypothetical protein
MCGAVSLDGENELFNTARLTVRAGHDWSEWEAISETHHARVCQTDESHTGQARHDFVGGICADCGYKMPGVTFVSGTVTSFNSETDDITIELFAEGSTTADYTVTVKGNTAEYIIEGVAEGTYTMRVSKNKHIPREYTVIVGTEDVVQDAKIHTKGDVDGDGMLSTTDYIIVKRAYMNTYKLNDVEFLAADIDEDDAITTADYIFVKRAYMGTYEING